ncbi:hypothetical protein [Prosthecobacter sp.]|uniref:hypothetical protein n=1 Tax=Prosthecobacter sp. TaxID=1965333 RepID=UPI002ABD0CD6|nr:hypothetical protein [Prosthecobacter sp.]MDZ4403207.1 hypothetical protein [Prosthecobacter sp.]
MNENELDHMLKRAAITGAMTGISLGSEVMARVRVDEGRAKRWRSFVRWLLILAAISGVVTAGMVGWSMALRDTTHTTPPTMNLFREGAKP